MAEIDAGDPAYQTSVTVGLLNNDYGQKYVKPRAKVALTPTFFCFGICNCHDGQWQKNDPYIQQHVERGRKKLNSFDISTTTFDASVPIIIDRTAKKAYSQNTGNIVQTDHQV